MDLYRMKKKKKISVLGLMMITSQLLLSIFLGYWLVSQYAENRKVLSTEIERGLRTSEEQAIDSLLADNIINPLINDSGSLSVYMFDGHISDTSNQPVEMQMNLDSAPQMQMHISERHHEKQQVIKRIERVDSMSHFGNQKIQSTVTVSAGEDSGNQLLFQGVKLLINAVGSFDMNHNSICTFFASNPDTTILTNIFDKFIEQHYNAFSVTWQSIDEPQNDDVFSTIIFSSGLFENPYGVSITGFHPYLLKSISPQIIFALILLFITGLAFRMAFINLKNQRKLLTIKNDFISNITHELKTPVSTVKVALEALLDFNLRNDPQRTKEYLEMAHSEIDRLDLLVNQVLDNSALEDSTSFISTENVDLVSLVKEVTKSMQSRFDKTKTIVHFNSSEEEIIVKADKLHLHGVIVNLLDNSLKYTEHNPEITIEIGQDHKETILTVSDNGIGIPDEYIKRVFDKFFRVPKGDSHNVKGYGLGLNYAALVMEHHQGKISVESNESGGCNFMLTFPQPKLT